MFPIDQESKRLAFLLRHDITGFRQGKIDDEGWRSVEELVRDQNFPSTKFLEEIVATDLKQRYEFNSAHTKIRAVQGHSIPVNVGLEETEPPEYLYHGTSTRFMESIFKNGIQPQSRLYVHLSQDIDTAKAVGLRHGGELLILTIKAKEMWNSGIKFWQAKNGVWLTKCVDPKFIKG